MIARLLSRLFVIAGVMLALGLLAFFALPAALVAPSDTPKADVIVDFAIDMHSKSDSYVAWLYRDGVARKVVAVVSTDGYLLYNSTISCSFTGNWMSSRLGRAVTRPL